MGGFDLTQFGSWNKTQQPQTPSVVQPVQAVSPAPSPQPAGQEGTIQDALTQKVNVELTDDEGQVWEDKLAKRAPGLKKALWGIDKFASKVRPIQVTNQKGHKVWIDQGGNMPLDPETGEILTKAPKIPPAEY